MFFDQLYIFAFEKIDMALDILILFDYLSKMHRKINNFGHFFSVKLKSRCVFDELYFRFCHFYIKLHLKTQFGTKLYRKKTIQIEILNR